MNVGIYTRWQRRDSTYAAIQVADLLTQRHAVTILTPTPRRPAVSGFWDGRVRHDVRFVDWAGPLDVVIWTACPRPEPVAWAAAAGKRTVLVPAWDDLDAIVRAGPRFGRIMAPTYRWARFFAALGARNVVTCPWSPMLPVTLRAPADPVRVYVPPIERPGEADDGLVVEVVEALLELDRSVRATVAIDGRRGGVVRRIERRAKAEPRLTLARPEDYHRQVLRYGEHSLTLIPGGAEGFGMSALCSLHMGTPVVGFDTPPLAELAGPGNSVLVEDRDGIDLLAALIPLVAGVGLAKLFAGCSRGLGRRRAGFEAAWGEALADGGRR
jgi:glycosyltransferase involved in cell wall biosynthesis